MDQVDDVVRPRRARGIRLGDLDRGRRYLIGYTGRRWEILDAEGIRPDAARTPADGRTASEAGTPAAGRHAAPDGSSS